ncbi:MAG TPA: serine hydrolase domain-containing protein [Gemmatimonadaceae bacterium]|jgi:CubicO group peptidase (beta-lactamase class C family)|nr:serine hydrolase domain-containing protein [Gemmatimonadaceae bacterium]
MRVGEWSRSFVLGALLVPAGVHAVRAQSLDPATARRIDSVFARFTPETPGCAAGVYQNGRVLFAKGYGSSNIEYGVPITPQTPFIMGSVSKQFTAAAIALLVQDGRIRLDDDVHKYVPELPDYGKKITIDQLVHHTSGLRDFWSLVDASGMRPDDGYTVGDVVKLASRQQHLNFDPGAEYNYSNTGYVLLGVIVQRASGKSLREFAAERIFRPLGMTVSHFHDDHTQPVRGRAIAYSPMAGGGWKINVWNNDIVGQGGLMTTLEELQKWDENFYTGTVGGPTLLSRQLERGVLNDGKQIAYAFGLEIGEYRGLPMVEHSGSTGGYRTDITRFPAQHTSVATMCNVSNADAVGLAHRVADVVLGSRFTKPATANVRGTGQTGASVVTLTPSERAVMTGRFYSPELDATYELRDVGEALVVVRARAVDTLRAVDRQTFRGAGYTLHFATANGAPTFTLDAGRIRGIEFRRAK